MEAVGARGLEAGVLCDQLGVHIGISLSSCKSDL